MEFPSSSWSPMEPQVLLASLSQKLRPPLNCMQAWTANPIPPFSSSCTSIQVPENASGLDQTLVLTIVSFPRVCLPCAPALTSKFCLGLCLNCYLGNPPSLLALGLHLMVFSLCYGLNCVPSSPSKSC